MSNSGQRHRIRRPGPRPRALAIVAASLVSIGALAWWRHERQLDDLLVRTEPSRALRDPGLRQHAIRVGRPLFQKHCSACHGVDLHGNRRLGTPDVARNAWLYGSDPVDVEHTIYYGIRSGHPKARNLTDMPAMVRTGQITSADAIDVVEYMQSLAGQPGDQAAVIRGRAIYFGQGNCFDCHATDAKGVVDYGTPGLTGPFYLYGGDRATLVDTVTNGRHGTCPAWVDVLAPEQIRAIAFYMISRSVPPAAAEPGENSAHDP